MHLAVDGTLGGLLAVSVLVMEMLAEGSLRNAKQDCASSWRLSMTSCAIHSPWQAGQSVAHSTGNMDTVAQLLGQASIDCSQCYVDVDQSVLFEMFADAV